MNPVVDSVKEAIADLVDSLPSPQKEIYMLLAKVTVLVNAFVAALSEKQALLDENAALKEQLSAAMASDAADAAAIEAAKADAADARIKADEAAAKVAELQALVDADADEDAKIDALIGGVLPAPEAPAP